MEKTGQAYFVHRPRKLKDLFRIHALDQERPYAVTKTITLPLIDYENFITDMRADRQYLKDYAEYCSKINFVGRVVGAAGDDTWKCLLIKRRGHRDGVLVIPGHECWVDWAAYLFPAKTE